jgi:hypothetical protein
MRNRFSFIELMPAKRRGSWLLWILWPLAVISGGMIVLGSAGVRLPLWSDHLHVARRWPPVVYVSGPHRPNDDAPAATVRP